VRRSTALDDHDVGIADPGIDHEIGETM